MGESGVLGPDERVELLNGEVVPMSPIGSEHGSIVDLLAEFFHRVSGGRFAIRTQGPLALSDCSEPEPDLMLLRRDRAPFRTGHPTPEDVLLLIEVADSSRQRDLGAKLALYAAGGIAEYWVADIAAQTMIVHRDPDPASLMYRSVERFGRGQQVAPLAADDCQLDLAWLFGPTAA
jgi:Uma2 family endonuclease